MAGTNFTWIDGSIVVVYLATLTGIGVYFSRRQTSLDEFFRAGRLMAWLPIGMSLMAALNSGIDYLAQPWATIKYGLILLVGTPCWILLYFWAGHVTVPFFRRLNVFSAYEYLERRFDVSVRTLAAVIFILWRVGWMATAMYVPCLAVHAATGKTIPLLPMIIVVGAIVTLYTMLGGIKAVVWTDVVQFCVMFGGLAATVTIILLNIPGGVAEVWTTAREAGKATLSVPIEGMAKAGPMERILLFMREPVTVVGLIVATLVGRMTLYTSDQVMVQRFQTTRSLKDSRRGFIINAVGDAVWMVGLSFVGLALFAYFQHHALPEECKGDRILPFFMSQNFPVGIVGLVVAAIFAASLSSIDSAINSCTSVATVDFYNRLVLKRAVTDVQQLSEAEQRAQVRVSRIFNVMFGAAGVALAANVGKVGDLIEICHKVINSFTGPIFGIFILGMFSRRARSVGVLVGGVVGTLVSVYVAFFSSLSFVWPSTFGLAATLGLGYLISALCGPPDKARQTLTFREVMATGAQDEQSR